MTKTDALHDSPLLAHTHVNFNSNCADLLICNTKAYVQLNLVQKLLDVFAVGRALFRDIR